MSDFNIKNKRSFWHSPIILLVIFCIVVIFAYNIIGLAEKQRDTSKKKEQILSEIESLREREKTLNNSIEKLKTSNGIEETIRDKYQVVKDGEKMVIIVDEDDKNNGEVEKEVKTEHGFLSWIKSTFGL